MVAVFCRQNKNNAHVQYTHFNKRKVVIQWHCFIWHLWLVISRWPDNLANFDVQINSVFATRVYEPKKTPATSLNVMTKNIILTAGLLLLLLFFFFSIAALSVRLWVPFWDPHLFLQVFVSRMSNPQTGEPGFYFVVCSSREVDKRLRVPPNLLVVGYWLAPLMRPVQLG